MKTILSALAAAGLLLASSAHAASPGELQRILTSARAAADARLNQAGVSLGDQTVGVEMTMTRLGALGDPRLIRSSGSPETDARVTKALRRLQVTEIPSDLIGAHLTLVLGRSEIVQAQAW